MNRSLFSTTSFKPQLLHSRQLRRLSYQQICCHEMDFGEKKEFDAGKRKNYFVFSLKKKVLKSAETFMYNSW